MKTMFFATALVASAIATAAGHAADVADVAGLAEPAAPYSWSGVYVGLQAGGAWARADDGSDHVDLSGGAIGGYAGLNWQSGALVLGIEGDVNYTSNDGSIYGIGVGTEWQGAVRGRVGYAMDRVLLYGTAGLAISEVYIDAAPIIDATETFTGWTIGGGLEYAFTDNWTTRLDYRYSDYGSSNFGLSGADAFDVTEHAVRVGIGYKF